jgi:ribosome maturation factor RimP
MPPGSGFTQSRTELIRNGHCAHFLFVRTELAIFMQLVDLIEQTVTGLGYELVDFDTSPRARLLTVYIDKPDGVNIDDCATVSNQLTRVFTVENIDFDRLEVSSPGLDRPLKKLSDFERFAGQQASVRLRVAVDNQRNFTGTLLGVRDGRVCLDTEKGELLIALEELDKARLVPKF